MKRGTYHCHAIHRRGAAIVEFAIVLPILLFCFSTMVEITRILLLQNSADTAAYEGARCSMVPGAKPDEAAIAANSLLRAAGLKGCVVKISPDSITEETALIIVSVEIPVAKNAWITPFWFLPDSITSQVALVCERPPAVQLTAIPTLGAIDVALKIGLGPADILSLGSQRSSTRVSGIGINSENVGIQTAGTQTNVPILGFQSSPSPRTPSNL